MVCALYREICSSIIWNKFAIEDLFNHIFKFIYLSWINHFLRGFTISTGLFYFPLIQSLTILMTRRRGYELTLLVGL